MGGWVGGVPTSRQTATPAQPRTVEQLGLGYIKRLNDVGHTHWSQDVYFG